MTVLTRKQIKTLRRPVPRVVRNHKVSARKAASPKPAPTVYLVRPKGTPAAIARGRRLADEVRKELAVLDNASLDETMRGLRGRSWSL
jgi:hypothetical protein